MTVHPNMVRRPSLIERAAMVHQLADLHARIPAGSFGLHDPGVAPAADFLADGSLAHVDCAELARAGFVVPDGAPIALAEEFRIVKRQLLLSALGGRTSRLSAMAAPFSFLRPSRTRARPTAPSISRSRWRARRI